MRVAEQKVLDLMKQIGGGFASALAVAWERADSSNQAKLMREFYDLYQHYLELWNLRENDNGS